MIPTWLQPILEAKGAWNTDGIARAARAGFCRTCGAVVVRGLDADRAALCAVCDPEPLNALGEFLALAAGRRTYDMSWRGRCELNPREPAHIQAAPAGSQWRASVVGEHICGDPLPSEGRGIVTPKEPIAGEVPF